jgi:hypothetical protein
MYVSTKRFVCNTCVSMRSIFHITYAFFNEIGSFEKTEGTNLNFTYIIEININLIWDDLNLNDLKWDF